jgi:DNA topoisomerase-1
VGKLPRPPGLTRVDGQWVDARGEGVDAATQTRVKAMAIPPAWTNVWVDPDPGAALQATGVDARGRTQYRYAAHVVELRSRDKFEHVLRFSAALPGLRARVEAALAAPAGSRHDDLGLDRVMAATLRLLDRGFFRVGNEGYARDNHTYGLTTLRREHVTVRASRLEFDYIAKEHRHRVVAIDDAEAADVVRRLLRRPDDSPVLLAYRSHGSAWSHVTSALVNAWVHRLTGLDASAKSFRTWAGTVLAASALGGAEVDELIHVRTRGDSGSAETSAVAATSRLLGNTPAVARASYIHPGVLTAAREGHTVADAVEAAAQRQGSARLADIWTNPELQAAVHDLLGTGAP